MHGGLKRLDMPPLTFDQRMEELTSDLIENYGVNVNIDMTGDVTSYEVYDNQNEEKPWYKIKFIEDPDVGPPVHGSYTITVWSGTGNSDDSRSVSRELKGRYRFTIGSGLSRETDHFFGSPDDMCKWLRQAFYG